MFSMLGVDHVVQQRRKLKRFFEKDLILPYLQQHNINYKEVVEGVGKRLQLDVLTVFKAIKSLGLFQFRVMWLNLPAFGNSLSD